MKPINIYSLTRLIKIDNLKRLEKQMSGRPYPLSIKDWEISNLKGLSDHLCKGMIDGANMRFYYSFQIPKLGKEFDLIRVSEDYVINIELKSGNVSDERIKNQLMQNRYYLAPLSKTIRSYTYIGDTDRLVRLTNGGRLIDEKWEVLFEDLSKQTSCYEDNIEKLFKEENFLISPLSDPDRFLRKEYFLTSQQKDIKSAILKRIKAGQMSLQGFTGLPGTGKTLLLYDIAMQLSWRQKVCVLHLGSFPEELNIFNKRLKRVDFYPAHLPKDVPDMAGYFAILIDEGHRLNKDLWDAVCAQADRYRLPVVVSYDKEDVVSPLEKANDNVVSLGAVKEFVSYKLTNRIRMNGELSSFIHCLMQASASHRRKDYPSVELAFANNEDEMQVLTDNFKRNGYIYIYDDNASRGDTRCGANIEAHVNANEEVIYEIDAGKATCKEFEKVVMVIDESFDYDRDGYLISHSNAGASKVRKLFHGLNRAKRGLAIVVLGNKYIFEELLRIVQGR